MALELGTSKADVMAIVEEVTPGTIVDPSSGDDYLTLQPSTTFTPAFESLTNDEIRASIAPAKPIQGLEQPTSSFSHYIKASGAEGTSPEFGKVLKSLFGSTSANATERSTTTGSTVNLLKLAAGGSDFARGKAVLIKDGVNGYRIRPVHSVNGNDLELGFQVPTALQPASGVALGKCVNFAPVNSGHPSLSMHMYRGNGQAYEAMAGAQCTGLEISSPAGQNINGNFSFQGTKYFFNPIRITATNKFIDFEDSIGVEVASIPEGVYRDPNELAQALQDAMNAVSDDEFVVVFNSKGTNKGKFTITSDGTTLKLLWDTGANAANTIGTALGFSVAADDTGALTYTGDNQKTWGAPHTPSYDPTAPVAAKGQEVLLGDSVDFECFKAGNVGVSIGKTAENVLSICAESGVEQNIATGRAVTITIQALLDKHEAENFKRFRKGDTTRFCYNFGVKSGGNWVPGHCVNIYIPTAVISSFSVTEVNSVHALDLTLTAFADENGNGECYMNFL